MDFKHLAEQLEMDETDFMELIDLFVDTTRRDIAGIRAALSAGDAVGAASGAHSIKGASGNLGLDELFVMAREMEMLAKKGSLDDFEDRIRAVETRVNALYSSARG